MEWLKVGAVGCTVVLLAGQLACTAPLVQSQAERPAALVGTHTGALTASVLAGTAWTAFAIDGVAEVLNPKPRLRWDLSQRVTGTGGCNAFTGNSAVGLDTLRLGPLAAMGKACVTLPGAQEDRFFMALERTRKARLEGEQLVLLDASGQVLARFLPGN